MPRSAFDEMQGRRQAPPTPQGKGILPTPRTRPYVAPGQGEMRAFGHGGGSAYEGLPGIPNLPQGPGGAGAGSGSGQFLLNPNEVGGGAPNNPPITERYDDSYRQLLESLRQGKSGNELLQDLLGGFRGSIGDLQKFMETPAYRGALAYSMKGTPAYQQLVGLQDPTKQALSIGLGQISQAGARGVEQSLQALNQAGMGRNIGATQAIQQGGRLDTAARQAQFTAGINQQLYQNERQRLGAILELEQAMQQLALGYQPRPRTEGNSPSTGDWIKLGLEAAGTVAAFV